MLKGYITLDARELDDLHPARASTVQPLSLQAGDLPFCTRTASEQE
mgnify:CR=1 FL=1